MNNDEQEKARAEEELALFIPQQRARWTEASAIPPKYAGATFENFNKEKQPAAFEFMNAYNWHSGKSAVLYSPKTFGVGKTHLVCALLHKIIATEEVARIRAERVTFSSWKAKGGYEQAMNYRLLGQSCPLYFATEIELLARIRATFAPDPTETEEQLFAQLKTCGLLVIDDVGKVRPRDSSFVQGCYYRIIDGRYGNMKPIILTTNLDLAGLEAHIGGACADRLVQMCGRNYVKMIGKSYREEVDID